MSLRLRSRKENWLERFAALSDLRRGTNAWLKVVETLDNREMPSAESKQPSRDQRKQDCRL